jgi:hypothetical protein
VDVPLPLGEATPPQQSVPLWTTAPAMPQHLGSPGNTIDIAHIIMGSQHGIAGLLLQP